MSKVYWTTIGFVPPPAPPFALPPAAPPVALAPPPAAGSGASLLLPQAMEVSMSAAAPSPTMIEDRAPKFFMIRISLN